MNATRRLPQTNPNCCGSGPCTGAGTVAGAEVRVLRLPGDGNLILCFACFCREIAWRRERNCGLGREAAYPLPRWSELPVYDPGATP